MKQTKRDQSDLIAFRIPQELRESLPKENVSAYVKEALREKIERERGLKTCPTCKGTGKIKR